MPTVPSLPIARLKAVCGAPDPYADVKDVLERLPTHAASRIDEVLPHRGRATRAH